MIRTIFFSMTALLSSWMNADAFDQTHGIWDSVVSTHVEGSDFDYQAAESEKVDAYLDKLASVPRPTFDGWDESERLAFLINLYNAATVKLILDHLPVESIREVNAGEPWKLEFVRVFGGRVSLDHLEHGMIRELFAEPRIHFAVNCASKGCPPLRDEAYTGAKLDSQLAEQTRSFLGNRKFNRVEGDTLWLTPLFDWYAGDFTKAAGSIEKFVAPYFPEDERRRIRSGGLELRFTDWDWSLNDA